MPNRRHVSGSAVCLSLALVMTAAATRGQPVEPQTNAIEEPATAPAAPISGANNATATPPRETEAPLESPADGATLFEYEPSETISEDNSVSFPIDI